MARYTKYLKYIDHRLLRYAENLLKGVMGFIIIIIYVISTYALKNHNLEDSFDEVEKII